MLTNAEVAQVFRHMADLLDLKGEERFKVRAYQRAARSIDYLPRGLKEVAAEGALEEVPGVGVARRGWCEPHHIQNTRPLDDSLASLKGGQG